MRTMHDVPDLDLLRTFDVLYRERHLTRAAARLGRSQPALSRALGRMREAFGDALFVRTPRGMLPTARAEALAPEVQRVLEAARALVAPSRFDAATLRRTFVIATSDLVEQHVVAGLVHAVSREAPGVDVTLRPVGPDVADLLAARVVDLVAVPKAGIPAGTITQHLYDDGFSCAARADHPVVKRRLTLEQFVALSHVQIAPRGTPGGPVDDALARLGLARRVAVRTSSFLAAPLLASRSDLILTAPTRMLVPMAQRFGLRTFPTPLAVAGFQVHQAWHPRVHEDPAHRWFRGVVSAVAKKMPEK